MGEKLLPPGDLTVNHIIAERCKIDLFPLSYLRVDGKYREIWIQWRNEAGALDDKG